MMFRAKLFIMLGLALACGGCDKLMRQKITLDKDTIITLHRTSCYHGCSPYEVTIYADGTVVFEGSKYIRDDKIGETTQPLEKQTSKISLEQLQLLVSEFDRINYFALKDEYISERDCPDYWSDAPFANTSIRTNGKSKSIKHYVGCRGNDTLRNLIALEEKIDEIANTKQWLK